MARGYRLKSRCSIFSTPLPILHILFTKVVEMSLSTILAEGQIGQSPYFLSEENKSTEKPHCITYLSSVSDLRKNRLVYYFSIFKVFLFFS